VARRHPAARQIPRPRDQFPIGEWPVIAGFGKIFRDCNFQRPAAKSPPQWCIVAENNNRNRRASLVTLGVVIVLLVIGWIITHELYSNSKIEDCVLSGRTNCVPIDTKSSTY
jgi:hypothetical protein